MCVWRVGSAASTHPFLSDRMDELLLTYAGSHFCLVPEGDTPTRAAIWDALSTLCIPVFFSDCLRDDLLFETMYAPFLPAHARLSWGLGSWAVVLDAREVEAQGFAYIVRALTAIDDASRRRTRRTILGMITRFSFVKARHWWLHSTATPAAPLSSNATSWRPLQPKQRGTGFRRRLVPLDGAMVHAFDEQDGEVVGDASDVYVREVQHKLQMARARASHHTRHSSSAEEV